LTGSWTQGGLPLRLVLARQAVAIERPRVAIDAAIPAVDVASLREVMDADMAAALDRGELAPKTGGGVAIGVIEHGARRVFVYGAVKPDSVFEIGSITKTFTALILAQMAAKKQVRLNEPVRELLPPGTVEKPAGEGEVTLLDLSDQHSGLPRMPDNFHPADPTNPYADYDEKALYAWLKSHGVALAPNAPFGYSNVGVGLLGSALAHRAGVTYEALLKQQVTQPLGMRDTAITLTSSMRARLAPGHDPSHAPARGWELDALAGAGAIRSTAADMLTYLDAQLHPERLPRSVSLVAAGRTLRSAITDSHVVHADAGPGMHIALNWMRVDETGSYWHNGATGGYSADAIFSPVRDFAVIVLSNTAPGADDFADAVAKHVVQRLSGQPAVSLAPLSE
jgi:CubicO group peptidase (beta-lactamase class C family)